MSFRIGSDTLKRVRERVEPELLARGYVFQPSEVRQRVFHRFYDYSRGAESITLSYSAREAVFIAEWLDAQGECRTVSRVAMNRPRDTDQIVERCNTFADEVTRFLQVTSIHN